MEAEWSQSPVPPRKRQAYETRVSTGSTAVTTQTVLWGLQKWSARDDLHVQGCLILSQVGLLFPVNHAPLKLASLTGFAPVISCMRGRHVGWTTPQEQ